MRAYVAFLGFPLAGRPLRVCCARQRIEQCVDVPSTRAALSIPSAMDAKVGAALDFLVSYMTLASGVAGAHKSLSIRKNGSN